MLFDISPLSGCGVSEAPPKTEPVTRMMIGLALPKSWPDPRFTISGDGARHFRTNETFTNLLAAAKSHLVGREASMSFYLRRYRSNLPEWQKLVCRFVREQFNPGDRRSVEIEPSWNWTRTERESWTFSYESGGFIQIVHHWPPGVAAHYQLWITENVKDRFKIDED